MTELNLQLEWCSTGHIVGVNDEDEIAIFDKSAAGAKTELIFVDGVLCPKSNPELALDVPAACLGEGVKLILYPRHGGGNQNWKLGYETIHSNMDTKFVLAVANDALVVQKNTGKQLWHGIKSNDADNRNVQLKWCKTGDVIGVQDDGYVRTFPFTEIGPHTDWLYSEGTLVSCFDSNLALDIPAGDVSDGVKIIAYSKHGGPNQLWHFRNGYFHSEADQSFVLSVVDGFLVIEEKRNDSSQKWCEFPVSSDQLPNTEHRPRPATSCHLGYGQIPAELAACKSWKLKNTVKPLKTEDSTYFCVIGWGPAGYSGIQESENKRNFIFSMWNDGGYNVTKESAGDGVIVSEFGGEGTGLKSMKDIQWKNNEPITFTVSGTRQDDDSWICDCNVFMDNKNYFMASFRRYGPHPLTYFYSFVEDWNRSWKSCGHSLCREAEFYSPSIEIDGRKFELTEARFTKVEHGCDAFAVDKARGGARDGKFFLASGGNECFDCRNGCCFNL